MGNQKNKRNHGNNHRRSMQKRCGPEKYKSAKKKCTAAAKHQLQGSRIVNLDQLSKFVEQLTAHAASCGSQIILNGEKRAGLASIISSKCSKCNFTIPLRSSERVLGPNGKSQWKVNLDAVWGQMTTGGGYSRLQETMSIFDVPVMAPKNFINAERRIGLWWQQQLQEVMAEAGREENRFAEERNDFHEGVPTITVVVDGGWSKCSHRHSYNAKSGVGIIIGQATGKLLHIGIRNKYCTSCTQGIPQEKHNCFRNWSHSSSEMEPDIIRRLQTGGKCPWCQVHEIYW